MQQQLFELLMDKYLNGTADEAERKIIEEYLDRMAVKFPENLANEDVEVYTAKVYQQLTRQIASEKAPVIPMKKKWLLRVAVAAAILIAASLSIIYFNSNNPSKTIATVNHDVMPGRTAAVLTLANGKEIILDSVPNGLLAVEGGVNINNVEGAINYAGNSSANNLFNTLTTRRGEQYKALKLADGTKVWLNSNSSIRFPVAFNDKERKVSVTGEVYFEVAKDKSKPFIVNLSPAGGSGGAFRDPKSGKDGRDAEGGLQIMVLGTSFNINAYPDENTIKTTLVEGSVKVLVNNNELKLQPAQQAQLTGNKLVLNKNIDIEEVMAWKDGLFQFESSDLKQVMRQLSRWYDVDIVIEPGVTDRKFFGSISRDIPLSGVLKILSASDIKCRIEGRKLILMK